MSQDSNASIFQSAKRFFSGTILSRVSGLFRDIAMASAFGTQETVAAFLVAFRFSHLLRRLLGEGALQTAFIPQFEKLRHDNPQRAAIFFKDLFSCLTLLLTILIIFSMAGLGLLLYFGNLTEGNQEITWLTFLMMPSLLFICLFGINASLLQCEKIYFIPSAAPIIFNLVWIAGVLCLKQSENIDTMSWLAGFVILACFSQWVVTIPYVWKSLRQYSTSWNTLSFLSKDVLALARPLFLGVIGVAASQINNALDSVFARYAEAEGPAFLWFAIRLQQLPLALFGIAISGALLPPLSRAIKSNDYTKFRMFLDFALTRSIALMLPMTFALFVMGDSCIELLYGRGDFQKESILGTLHCLWGYSFGLIPMTLVLLLAPAFYAKEDFKTTTQASLIAVGLNILLNILFVIQWNWKAGSVAFSTSLSAWVNALILSIAMRKQFGHFVSKNFYLCSGRILLASLGASLAILFIDMSHLNILLRFTFQTILFAGTLTLISWTLKAQKFLISPASIT